MSKQDNIKKRSNSSFATNTNNLNNPLRQTSSAKPPPTTKLTNDSNYLLNKEEEYKRLNDELEKKTATLVYEAEQVLKANEKLLNEADYLDKISDVNFLHTDNDKVVTRLNEKSQNKIKV